MPNGEAHDITEGIRRDVRWRRASDKELDGSNTVGRILRQ